MRSRRQFTLQAYLRATMVPEVAGAPPFCALPITFIFEHGFDNHMSEQRYVRFATLGELTKDELQLAVEIWFDDALQAPWASKDSMKLAGVLRHYMMNPNADGLNLKTIEDFYQLSADSARRALVQYTLYGMIEAHSTDRNQLRAALRLSRLQTLRVLEARQRLAELSGAGSHEANPKPMKSAEPVWVPESNEIEPTPAESSAVTADAQVAVRTDPEIVCERDGPAIHDEVDRPQERSPAASEPEQMPTCESLSDAPQTTTPLSGPAPASVAPGAALEPSLATPDRKECLPTVADEVTDAVKRFRSIRKAAEAASRPPGSVRLNANAQARAGTSHAVPPTEEELSGQAALARSLARLRQRA